MMVQETLSKFVQHPTEVIGRLDEGAVVLTRRKGRNLLLTWADDAQRDADLVGSVAALLGAIFHDETLRRRAEAQLSDAFPWVEFLPASAKVEFTDEFLRTARACASVRNFTKLRIALNAWAETAAIYADPDRLADTLSESSGEDLIPALDPRVG